MPTRNHDAAVDWLLHDAKDSATNDRTANRTYPTYQTMKRNIPWILALLAGLALIIIALTACSTTPVRTDAPDYVSTSPWTWTTGGVRYAQGQDGVYALQQAAVNAGTANGANVGANECWIRVQPEAPRTRCYVRTMQTAQDGTLKPVFFEH